MRINRSIRSGVFPPAAVSAKAEVAALRTEAGRADAYIAVANLLAIYGYSVDKSRSDDAADLFSRDATLQIAGRGLFTARDRIRE